MNQQSLAAASYGDNPKRYKKSYHEQIHGKPYQQVSAPAEHHPHK